jgi:hypothetical protein
VLVGSGNCEQSKVNFRFKLSNTREDHKTNSRLIIVEVYVVSSFRYLRDISNEIQKQDESSNSLENIVENAETFDCLLVVKVWYVMSSYSREHARFRAGSSNRVEGKESLWRESN